MWILNILIIFHIFIWCFILFGGLVYTPFSSINLLYLIPLVYLLHIFPFHFIIKTKIEFIEKNIDILWKNSYDSILYDEDECKLFNKYILNKEHHSKIIKILKANEYSYPIVKWYHSIRSFFKHSFQNPLSPQGMLILGSIINFYVYKYKKK